MRMREDYLGFKAYIREMIEPGDLRDIEQGTKVVEVEDPIVLKAFRPDQPVTGIVRVKLPDNSLWYVGYNE